jgi:hypothetical protein
MLFFNRCYHGGKLHCFEPRFDETEEKKAKTLNLTGIPSFDMPEILDAASDKKSTRTYVRDVCVWCGEVRERDCVVARPAPKVVETPKEKWKFADVPMNQTSDFFKLVIGKVGTIAPGGKSDDGKVDLVDFTEDGEVVPIQGIDPARLTRV